MEDICKVNVREKFALVRDFWDPKIAGELNESYVKLAKLKGEFLWHKYETEDEMFLIIRGALTIRFRDKNVVLNEGEFLVIPRGAEHLPVAEEEVWVMLVEAKTTLNTGDVQSDRTKEHLERI